MRKHLQDHQKERKEHQKKVWNIKRTQGTPSERHFQQKTKKDVQSNERPQFKSVLTCSESMDSIYVY